MFALRTVAAAAIVLQTIPGAALAQDLQKPRFQSRLKAEFPNVKGSPDLYEVDGSYVLKPVVIEKDVVAAVRVVPKYFFEAKHPNWQEPDAPVSMPVDAFHELLVRLERVHAIGGVARSGSIGVTMNVRTEFWDEHEEGIVERAMFRYSPEEEYSVAWFTVWYLREVTGRVQSKTEDVWQGRRVRLDSKTYWVPPGEFGGISVGLPARLRLAGPLDVAFGGDR